MRVSLEMPLRFGFTLVVGRNESLPSTSPLWAVPTTGMCDRVHIGVIKFCGMQSARCENLPIAQDPGHLLPAAGIRNNIIYSFFFRTRGAVAMTLVFGSIVIAAFAIVLANLAVRGL